MPTKAVIEQGGLHMKFAIVVAVVGAAAILGPAASAVTLDGVIAQGYVKCGVSEGT